MVAIAVFGELKVPIIKMVVLDYIIILGCMS